MVPFFPTAMQVEASSGHTPSRSSCVSVGTGDQAVPFQRAAAPLAPTAITFSGEVPATALRSARVSTSNPEKAAPFQCQAVPPAPTIHALLALDIHRE